MFMLKLLTLTEILLHKMFQFFDTASIELLNYLLSHWFPEVNEVFASYMLWMSLFPCFFSDWLNLHSSLLIVMLCSFVMMRLHTVMMIIIVTDWVFPYYNFQQSKISSRLFVIVLMPLGMPFTCLILYWWILTSLVSSSLWNWQTS